MWRTNVFASGQGLQLAGSCEESEDEAGLQEFLEDMGDAILLMERAVYDRFENACKAKGIKLGFFHCEQELSTS